SFCIEAINKQGAGAKLWKAGADFWCVTEQHGHTLSSIVLSHMPNAASPCLEGNCSSVHRGGINTARHPISAVEKSCHVALIRKASRLHCIGKRCQFTKR